MPLIVIWLTVVASFGNRDNVYKNVGYQYFFSARYYDSKGDNSIDYGLKDKLLEG
ncbi:hypothetical protein [Liquorilactobacillus nagelii]|jgi:lipoteichoic acid synthase|uniref:hypothetical protein n=1 Tax=Liquorilactobacillus nagelii TaxID=82688 RepID=UPI00192CF38B|nr:hypothetical protein [Liquorilactobacillus nagelii]